MNPVNYPRFEAAQETVGGEAPPEAAAPAPAKVKAVAEKVKLSDGREVEFAGKRKLLKESSGTEVDEVSLEFISQLTLPTVRLDFRNGETRSFVLPAALLFKFAAHGAEQKLGDETAGEDDVDDMVLSIDELIERLNKGEWSVKREGGGMAGTSVLIKALMEFSSHPVERVKEFLKNKTQAEKMALRTSPKLKPIVDRLEAEKTAKGAKVDVNALLGEL